MASKAPGGDPLVASLAHGGVGDLVGAEAFSVIPRTPRRKANEHDFEAVPVRTAGPVAAQRVGLGRYRHQRLDACPRRIEHFGVQRAHDVTGPPLSGRSLIAPRHHRRDNQATSGSISRETPGHRPFAAIRAASRTSRCGAANSCRPEAPCGLELDTGRCRMKAIVVTDEAEGTAGMTLVERP